MSIEFTTKQFPVQKALKERSGLPWGAAVTPLARGINITLPYQGGPTAEDLGRCHHCSAFINPYCRVMKTTRKWVCSLCFRTNTPTTRYDREPDDIRGLVEVVNTNIEVLIDTDDVESDPTPVVTGTITDELYQQQHSNTEQTNEPKQRVRDLTELPIYVCVVDISHTTEATQQLAVVRDALVACVEAIPTTSLFGVVTYSDRVGVMNLSSTLPHTHQMPVLVDENNNNNVNNSNNTTTNTPTQLTIDELLPFSQFLVRVDTHKHTIINSIENIQPLNSVCLSPSLSPQPSTDSPKRAFGAAVHSLIEFFSCYDSLNVRVLAFMSGEPNYGIGSVPNTSTKSTNDQLKETTLFYKQEAHCAVEAGMSFDLICLPSYSHTKFGLSSIKHLATQTGGRVSLYNTNDSTSLPQDIFRWLSGPTAFHCMLRLRTSTEMEIAHTYGNTFVDVEQTGLLHMQTCDPWKTVACDFSFTTPAGFRRDKNRIPVVQMAFGYTYLPPKGDPNRHLERRLRITTKQITVAHTLDTLYGNADSNVTMLLLMHKLSRAALQDGVREARLLMQDWLAILYTQYHEYIAKRGEAHTQSVVRNSSDLEFSKFPNLSTLPKLVLGLVKSSLLPPGGVDVDQWTALHCFYSEMNATQLSTALYPTLSRYESLESTPTTHCALSSKQLNTHNNEIWLLDCVTHVFVIYGSQVDSTVPFPPPKSSSIRQEIAMMKAARPTTVSVNFVRQPNTTETSTTNTEETSTNQQSSKEYEHVLRWMVDDTNDNGSGYEEFLSVCKAEIVALMDE